MKDILWSRRPKPALEEGEAIVLEGRAVLTQGISGMRVGPLILTNRRLIWYEPAVARPLKPIYGQLKLSDIASVDKGTLFDFIFGMKRLRLRLRSGNDKCLKEADGRIDEWITTISGLIANAEEP